MNIGQCWDRFKITTPRSRLKGGEKSSPTDNTCQFSMPNLIFTYFQKLKQKNTNFPFWATFAVCPNATRGVLAVCPSIFAPKS